MKQEQYDRFKELRQKYYLAGRCLLINQMFGVAGINFGYSIEISLKFLLALNGHPKSQLMKHHLGRYYRQVVDECYISELKASNDLLRFMDDRLNARYPTIITNQLAEYEFKQQAYVFTIDMLHCYDDFILQLDDAVSHAAGDPRISIGFRSCRELSSVDGRIFFHCNDHAFQRIPQYRQLLATNRDDGDDFEYIDGVLAEPAKLWNFKGLIAFRPWGPKSGWAPAESFVNPQYEENKIELRAAKWAANNLGIDTYFSSLSVVLPKGKYDFQIGEVVTPSEKDTKNGDEIS